MLTFLLLLSFFSNFFAYQPACSSCKHFIPHYKGYSDGISDLGRCQIFKNTITTKTGQYVIYDYATHCRNNEHMCGINGVFYEPIDSKMDVPEEITSAVDELKNRCCGEVNEKEELEQLEKEFFELFQKIKKYNKKTICKNTKDIYKLFKKK